MTTRTNAQWLADLRSPGSVREAALSDLRALILNGLPYALSGWLAPDDPHFDALAEDVAQETLVRVLQHLGTFEGRSQFATWAHKIAVRVALTELRRRRWKDVSLDAATDESEGDATPWLTADPSPGPEQAAERADLMNHLRRMMKEELTERQLRAMTAVMTRGLPMEVVAGQMGMERNALYKLLHDGRLKLKRRLEREGLVAGDVLAVFAAG